MERFLERNVPADQSDSEKIYSLLEAVYRPSTMGFDYDVTKTLTAEEAYLSGNGNCLAYANMFIAMARHVGLDARFQEVEVSPEWDSRKNTYVLSKHINVVVQGQFMDYVIDITRTRSNRWNDVQIIPDAEAKAQYFNNLGADALLDNDLPKAYAYFVRAIETHPGLAYVWSNLGVVYSRNGQAEDARNAYYLALQFDGKQQVAINNLAVIYKRLGNLEAASSLEDRVEKHRLKNPYYLLYLSEQAITEERYKDSLKLLKRAIRRKDDDHRFHFAIAKSLYFLGEIEDAQDSFDRAKRLAPWSAKKKLYDKSLTELVNSHSS